MFKQSSSSNYQTFRHLNEMDPMLRRIQRTGLKITRQITQLITARHIQKHMKLTIQETSSSYGKVSIQRTMTKIT